MTERIKIFDTTLRDGEQSPGFSMTAVEKLAMARQLQKLGVDIIEAGFPASSPGDFASVQQIAREVRGPIICGLARATRSDIEAAYNALKEAARPRIHTFIATSPIHMEKKLNLKPDEVLRRAVESVAYAKSLGVEVQFALEDCTRSDPAFVVAVCRAVIAAGATTINIPDTVGYAAPKEMFDLIRHIRSQIEPAENVTISCHCHNDLGLAVANSLAAIQAGAGQVEGTINGIGERAGNAAIEEIVMVLQTRYDHYLTAMGLRTEELYPTSKLLQVITGIHIQPNKAIVGTNAFAHEAGIHQDGMLKDRSTYEIMRPQDIGVPESVLVLGKHSGRRALKDRLVHLGLQGTDADVDKLFTRFKELADQKKYVTDDDLVMLLQEGSGTANGSLVKLNTCEIVTCTGAIPKATVRLCVGQDICKEEVASAEDPLEALYRAIDHSVGFSGRVLDYQVKSLAGGSNQTKEVTIQVSWRDQVSVGCGASQDLFEASALAYINALNRLAARLETFQQAAVGLDWFQRIFRD